MLSEQLRPAVLWFGLKHFLIIEHKPVSFCHHRIQSKNNLLTFVEVHTQLLNAVKRYNVCIHDCWPHNPTTFPIFPPLPLPFLLLSWFASFSLLDGWGYGLSFSFLSPCWNCCDVSLPWHVLKLCMHSLSSSAVCFPVLEFQSLSCTLWKRGKNTTTSRLLAR